MTPLEAALADLEAACADGNDAEWIDRAAKAVDALDIHPEPVPLVSAALWYAEQGLRVFPISPNGKIPLPSCDYCNKRKGGECSGPDECFHDHCHGCKDATNDADRIRAWWAETPDANVGLATGHLIDVVDIDGYEGQLSRCANWDSFQALTIIGTVSTPRPGGIHLYVPASGRGNKTDLFNKVDYRGRGGYVVAPPSRTNVGLYEWINPLEVTSLAGAA